MSVKVVLEINSLQVAFDAEMSLIQEAVDGVKAKSKKFGSTFIGELLYSLAQQPKPALDASFAVIAVAYIQSTVGADWADGTTWLIEVTKTSMQVSELAPDSYIACAVSAA